jgi:hypothetical protein
LFKAHAGPLPIKPENLETYEALVAMNLPLVAGGFEDQPYIWTLQYLEMHEITKMIKHAESVPLGT